MSGLRGALIGTLVLVAWGCAGTRTDVGYHRAVEVAAGARAAAAGARAELPERPVLEDYLAAAERANPGVRAAYHRWQAALARAPQARGLPDPQLNYAYFPREVETRVGPQEHRLGLSQTIPWPGKLVLGGQAAEAAARAERHRYRKARLALAREVKHAYYEYWYLARAVEVSEENLGLARRLEGVARARYRAAAAGHPDVIRAQVEVGRLEDRLTSLRALRGPVAAGLNALLDREVDAPLAWPERGPEVASLAESDDEIERKLRESSPDLAALAAEVQRADKAVRRARQSWVPDVKLGVDWMVTGEPDGPMPTEDRGRDAVAVGVGISLPLWFGKHRAAAREARSSLAAARLARRDRENLLLARLRRTAYEVRDAERKVALYGETLIPKAEQALGAAETAFRAGKAGFGDLVDAQRVLLEFRLTRERELARHAQRIAELETLTGRELGTAPAGGEPPPEEKPVPPAAKEVGE
jgi:outer membrane protein TolC